METRRDGRSRGRNSRGKGRRGKERKEHTLRDRLGGWTGPQWTVGDGRLRPSVTEDRRDREDPDGVDSRSRTKRTGSGEEILIAGRSYGMHGVRRGEKEPRLASAGLRHWLGAVSSAVAVVSCCCVDDRG